MARRKQQNNSDASESADQPKKRGRKPDTPEQKAAKAAAKQEAKAAADRATGERRVEAAKVAAGHNSADPRKKAIFLDAVAKVARLKDRIASVTGELRAFYKDMQRDGFTKDQFETAILVQTPEGEAKVKERMEKALQAAQFVGAMLGKSLDLFAEPDRTPAADRAYEEGQRASMENKAALPPYAPETEQFRRYMEGFHDHQASLAQFKPINPPSPPPASEVTSGTPMTRQAYVEQQQAGAPLPPTTQIAGSGAESDSDADDGDDGEEFADRSAA